MSTVPNSQEKRTIKVKDFLEDFRSGVSDEDLLVKYNLTPTGLDKFYGMLQEKGILDSEEIEEHCRPTHSSSAVDDSVRGDASSFICPSCLASHDVMFDVCPKCGVSFQELISREDDVLGPAPHGAGDHLGASPHELERDAEFFDSFAGSPHSKDDAIAEHPLNVMCYADSVPAGAIPTHFMQREKLETNRAGFAEPPDEIVPGLPLDAYEDTPYSAPVHEARCDGCNGQMIPGVREIYDRARSLHALAGAGICMLMGFLGIAALGWFEGYSFGRLMVVYFTGASMIFGAVLSAVGAFMYLAAEKVFFCPGCERVYPRG